MEKQAHNISFFIPAYNCAGTVAQSVESILTGNFNNGDELIIVNDCASDNTADVLSALKAKYPQIQILTHKRNKGGAAARNTAAEHAENALLFCLDADNVLAPNSIEPLKEFLLAKQADIASFEHLKYFTSDTSVNEETLNFKSGVFSITDLLSGKPSPGSSGNYLFTKESWLKANGYAEDLGALDTWSFGFKQLMAGCKMMVMPDSYYFHRRGHESYYIRDAWKRRRSVSMRLIKLIIEYADRIHPDDLNYIFSKKGRHSWFDNLKKRPIRLNTEESNTAIWNEHVVDNMLLNKAKHYRNRLQQVIKRTPSK